MMPLVAARENKKWYRVVKGRNFKGE